MQLMVMTFAVTFDSCSLLSLLALQGITSMSPIKLDVGAQLTFVFIVMFFFFIYPNDISKVI